MGNELLRQCLPEMSLSVLRPGTYEQHVELAGGRASAWGVAARVDLDGEELVWTIEATAEAWDRFADL